MPFNGSGTYILPVTSLSPTAASGSVIVSADFNTLTNDLETALTNCLTSDGNKTAAADMPMGGFNHTGVDDATALTEYASANQVVDNALSYCATPSAVGTDAYAVSLPVSPGVYAAGNRFQFIPEVVNTGACSVDFNSLGAKNIKMADAADPYNGAIQADVPCDVMYDGTSFILMNPYSVGAGSTSSAAELNYNDITTLGTTQASKVLTADGSAAIDNSAATWTDLGAVTTTDINGGTVDGVIIGGAAPVAITGTTIKANTSFEGAAGAAITDFETTSTNSATKVPTSSAMETYADAAAAAVGITTATTASRGLITAGLATQAHGFGALPDMVKVVLRCTTNDQGYVVGDEITMDRAGSSVAGYTVYADATNVYVAIDAIGDTIDVVDPAGGSTIQLDASDWIVDATGYKFP